MSLLARSEYANVENSSNSCRDGLCVVINYCSDAFSSLYSAIYKCFSSNDSSFPYARSTFYCLLLLISTLV